MFRLAAALAFGAAGLAQHTVSFPALDGGRIYGDVYGASTRAVLLLHGGRFDKASWKKQGNLLAAHDFRALSIDFRGEGNSRGGSKGPANEDARYLDVLGAIHYLHASGSKSVSVLGASMGGDYAAQAAQSEPEQIRKLVLLASGAYTPLTKYHGPKLFILARDDANAEGLRLPHIRAAYKQALAPKRLVLLDGSAHAQFLFETPQADRLTHEILTFLTDP